MDGKQILGIDDHIAMRMCDSAIVFHSYSCNMVDVDDASARPCHPVRPAAQSCSRMNSNLNESDARSSILLQIPIRMLE